jgi:hypothetical protein
MISFLLDYIKSMASLEICRQESKLRGKIIILAKARIVLNVVFDFDT